MQMSSINPSLWNSLQFNIKQKNCIFDVKKMSASNLSPLGALLYFLQSSTNLVVCLTPFGLKEGNFTRMDHYTFTSTT